jgi:phosphohistidine swiveling domain-containing protein
MRSGIFVSKKFIVIGKDFHSPLVRNEIWVGFCYLWPELFSLPRPDVGIYSHEDSISYVADSESWLSAKDIFQKRVRENPDVLVDAIQRSEEWGQEMNLFTRRIKQEDLSRWSSTDLFSFYQAYVRFQKRQYAIGILLPLIDIGGFSFLEDFLRSYLKQYLPQEEVPHAFGVFTTPTKNSFSLDQEEALLAIAADFFDNPRVQVIRREMSADNALRAFQKEFPVLFSKIKQHSEKFAWVYYAYAGPSFTETDFVGFLIDYARKGVNPQKEIEKLHADRAELVKEKQRLIETLKPDSASRKLIGLIGDYVWSKPRRKDYQSRSYCDVEALYQHLALTNSMSLRDVRSMTQKQIEDVIRGSSISVQNLDAQYRDHFIFSSDEGVRFLFDQEAVSQFQEMVELEGGGIPSAGILKGSTAYRGSAKGIVRIINVPEDMPKMNNGDILVSIATTPSIVPAMKRAAAIISDEGGLTCHAAIVARELKKPCIVGTKYATKTLKDGDLVEVDANAGLVTVLRVFQSKL